MAVALLRQGIHPRGGGCICLGGDCPNCLVEVDGVAYVRSCQVAARPGLEVARQTDTPRLPEESRR
ncbi:MAG: 2Fe-2S iron-sulfur cluster-binding protein, partial [Acidimicrobiia bacterium]